MTLKPFYELTIVSITFPYASHNRVSVYMEMSGRALGSQLLGILVFTQIFGEDLNYRTFKSCANVSK